MISEAVWYRANTGFTPARDYLGKYFPLPEDNTIQNKKLKIYSKIRSLIQVALERDGVIGGTCSALVRGYGFQELRIKNGSNLIRILYFCYHKDRLVLLSGFDKREPYGKKVERMIKEEYDRAQKYYEDFINNPKNYEKYE